MRYNFTKMLCGFKFMTTPTILQCTTETSQQITREEGYVKPTNILDTVITSGSQGTEYEDGSLMRNCTM